MNFSQLRFGCARRALSRGALGAVPRLRSDLPGCGHAVSRRRFLRSVAGTAGVILGSNLLPQARADGSFDPTPIPGGNYFLGSPGPLFHVFGPGFGGDPATVDQQPSTVTDFDGFI